MSTTVLVTGASGFIGRHVTDLLGEQDLPCIALSRSGGGTQDGVEHVQGDITNPEDLDRAIRDRDVSVVIHLAAATGKAGASEMERVNVGGTKAVVDACERHGVRRLVHVSTIAVTYPDLSHYPYGESKRQAETVVADSELDWTIVRPTIVLGPGSPAVGPFQSLAAGPFMMVPGGGSVIVQPVDVRDVAAAIVAIVQAEGADRESVIGATLEFGGPERISMKQLLAKVRARSGRAGAASLTLPLGLLAPAAALATALLGSRSPVTPGQLTAFRYDSAAEPLPPELGMRMERSIDQMLATVGADST